MALADFNQAIKLDPYYVWAITCRGETYRLMERYNKALADFNQAIKLEPNDDWYLYNRALTFLLLGQANESQTDLVAAIQQAQEGYKDNPRNWRNTLNLAIYNLVAGEYEEAEEIYREGLSSDAPPHIIREAIQDLDDLPTLLRDHTQARIMRKLLNSHLA